jgi:hypothetical protein
VNIHRRNNGTRRIWWGGKTKEVVGRKEVFGETKEKARSTNKLPESARLIQFNHIVRDR